MILTTQETQQWLDFANDRREHKCIATNSMEAFVYGMRAVQQTGWISVKDSLPELNVDGSKVFDSIDVIATDGIHVCTCEFQSGWYCMEQWFAWGNYNQIPKSQITHWQYMPKPPVEGF